MKSFPVFAVVLLASMLVPTVNHAQTVYVLDLGPALDMPCGGDSGTLLDRIREIVSSAVDAEWNQEGPLSIGLVTVAGNVRAHPPHTLSKADIERRLQALQVSSGTGSLVMGIEKASELLTRDFDADRRLIVLTPQPLTAELAAVLNRLAETGVGVGYTRLVFDRESAFEVSAVQLNIKTISCASGDSLTQATPGVASLTRIRERLAASLRVPVGLIEADTDLLADLGLDSMLVFETLVGICDAEQVKLPQQALPSTPREILAFLEAAEPIEPHRVRGHGGSMKRTQQVAVREVFYGTNRKPTGNSDPENHFGGERESASKMHYGIAEVSIPPYHLRGQIERPLVELRWFRDPKRHILVRKLNPMLHEAFFTALRAQLIAEEKPGSLAGELLLFFHGFNVSFDEAARRSAQIAIDVGFDGVVGMFSWPSDNSFASYVADREDVVWSALQLADFLRDIKDKAGPRRVHLLAHSMGSVGLLHALTYIALSSPDVEEPWFENVILAAPDFDAGLFAEQLAPRLRPLAKRWTVYASDRDSALNFSTRLNGAKRLGLPLTLVEGVDTVDASGIEVTPWSVPDFHSYFATKKQVIKDFIAVLRRAVKESHTRQVRRKEPDGISYWLLKQAE